MSFIVTTNVVDSQPHERRTTGTLTACTKNSWYNKTKFKSVQIEETLVLKFKFSFLPPWEIGLSVVGG